MNDEGDEADAPLVGAGVLVRECARIAFRDLAECIAAPSALAFDRADRTMFWLQMSAKAALEIIGKERQQWKKLSKKRARRKRARR